MFPLIFMNNRKEAPRPDIATPTPHPAATPHNAQRHTAVWAGGPAVGHHGAVGHHAMVGSCCGAVQVYFSDEQMGLFQQYFQHVPPPTYFHMLNATATKWCV